ncbi:hypothetical protein GCM10010869_26990 [Mesorhizobium tianshanense]|nr:hypothetical protein GCM10010869_26990 [Mesorhizobium tianshanense]
MAGAAWEESDDAGQAGIRSAAHLDIAESSPCVMVRSRKTTDLHEQSTDKCAVFACGKSMLASRRRSRFRPIP